MAKKYKLDTEDKQALHKAGLALLQTLQNSDHRLFEPEDFEDDSLRAQHAAYNAGYNTCRAEFMRAAADTVLEKLDDDYEDDDCDCDE